MRDWDESSARSEDEPILPGVPTNVSGFLSMIEQSSELPRSGEEDSCLPDQPPGPDPAGYELHTLRVEAGGKEWEIMSHVRACVW